MAVTEIHFAGETVAGGAVENWPLDLPDADEIISAEVSVYAEHPDGIYELSAFLFKNLPSPAADPAWPVFDGDGDGTAWGASSDDRTTFVTDGAATDLYTSGALPPFVGTFRSPYFADFHSEVEHVPTRGVWLLEVANNGSSVATIHNLTVRVTTAPATHLPLETYLASGWVTEVEGEIDAAALHFHRGRVYPEGRIHWDPSNASEATVIVPAGGIPAHMRPAADTEVPLYPSYAGSDSIYFGLHWRSVVGTDGSWTLLPLPGGPGYQPDYPVGDLNFAPVLNDPDLHWDAGLVVDDDRPNEEDLLYSLLGYSPLGDAPRIWWHGQRTHIEGTLETISDESTVYWYVPGFTSSESGRGIPVEAQPAIGHSLFVKDDAGDRYEVAIGDDTMRPVSSDPTGATGPVFVHTMARGVPQRGVVGTIGFVEDLPGAESALPEPSATARSFEFGLVTEVDTTPVAGTKVGVFANYIDVNNYYAIVYTRITNTANQYWQRTVIRRKGGVSTIFAQTNMGAGTLSGGVRTFVFTDRLRVEDLTESSEIKLSRIRTSLDNSHITLPIAEALPFGGKWGWFGTPTGSRSLARGTETFIPAYVGTPAEGDIYVLDGGWRNATREEYVAPSPGGNLAIGGVRTGRRRTPRRISGMRLS